ncbi:hypothetical protein TNCV_4475051 [Trichonephila clavipes]|nr:hypothetical protein TNCV_4475051 [Trichonephila clavipes]
MSRRWLMLLKCSTVEVAVKVGSLPLRIQRLFKGRIVTTTKVKRDVESLLLRRSRDSYSTIGPSTPSTVHFEDGVWCRN